jgi:hypothetical protein
MNQDGWMRSLERLIPTPESYRESRLTAAQALDILRCEEAVLERLADHGLRHEDGRFEFCDVMNVALYSNSGRSLPELGQMYAMRFAGGPCATWVAERNWQLSWDLRCPLRSDRPGGSWHIQRPAPEHFGGAVWQLRVDGQTPGEYRGELVVDDRERTIVTASLTTHGMINRVHSPMLRELFDGMLSDLKCGRYRFQWMPAALRRDPAAAARNGTMDCVSIALWLARQASEAGLHARTRQGWILGLLPVEHGWTEMLDEDGRWKVIDPLLAVLAERMSGLNAAFTTFCLGSASSQVLPFECAADEPLARHECPGGTDVQPEISRSVRPGRRSGGE